MKEAARRRRPGCGRTAVGRRQHTEGKQVLVLTASLSSKLHEQPRREKRARAIYKCTHAQSNYFRHYCRAKTVSFLGERSWNRNEPASLPAVVPPHPLVSPASYLPPFHRCQPTARPPAAFLPCLPCCLLFTAVRPQPGHLLPFCSLRAASSTPLSALPGYLLPALDSSCISSRSGCLNGFLLSALHFHYNFLTDFEDVRKSS